VLAVFASGLKEIVVDPVPIWQGVVAVAFMLVIMLIPYHGRPSSTRSVRARVLLRRMSDWLIDHNKWVEVEPASGQGDSRDALVEVL
jgi:hypothetical protein